MMMKISDEDKEFIRNKTFGNCGKCGVLFADLEYHHLIPKSLGGSDSKHNFVLLCSNCHTQDTDAAHRSQDTLKLLQKIYITDWVECYITREGRRKRKEERASLNKKMSEYRKKQYQKVKDKRKEERREKNKNKWKLKK